MSSSNIILFMMHPPYELELDTPYQITDVGATNVINIATPKGPVALGTNLTVNHVNTIRDRSVNGYMTVTLHEGGKITLTNLGGD